MSAWFEFLLGDLLQFQRGFDITKKEQQEGTVPIVSSSGITSFHNKAKVKGPGVVTGRKGSLGKVHYLIEDYWPHDTTLWIKDFKGNSPRFLYYLLQEIHLENYDVGASNPTLNRNHIHKIKLKAPHPDIQEKIAAILTAYDDLIENNNKRIALLEKAAEEIYREWFVRMRFPGWKQAKFEKSIPDGWSIKKVKQVADRKSFGRIYKENELSQDGTIIVIDQSRKPYLGFYDGEPEHKASSQEPIILFGDHSCKMELMMKPFSLAENIIPFTSKGNLQVLFLFYLIKGAVETTEYKRHWTELSYKEVLIPPSKLQQEFATLISNHVFQIDKFREINRKLSVVRDMLLPRLISGKLLVDELEIRFPLSKIAD